MKTAQDKTNRLQCTKNKKWRRWRQCINCAQSLIVQFPVPTHFIVEPKFSHKFTNSQAFSQAYNYNSTRKRETFEKGTAMANAKSFKGGLKGYWRKRAFTYSRLRHPTPSTVVLGSAADGDSATLGTVSASRRRRFWRIPRRIRFLRRIGSPKRWLAYLRDAYVRMMLHLANSASLGYGYGYGGADVAFGPQKWKEYDEKMLVEIYKQLLSQGAIVTAEAGVDGCQIVIKQ